MRALLILILAISLAPLALAAPKKLGVHRDWSAWQFGTKKARECVANSAPKKSEGKYSRRDPTSVSVTHRPRDQVKNEVSVAAGYTYKKDSEVVVTIDKRAFRLFVLDDTAFGRDAAIDATLVEAMKKGTRMTVEGTSSRGTRTKDAYSLAGFSAAYKAITRACSGL